MVFSHNIKFFRGKIGNHRLVCSECTDEDEPIERNKIYRKSRQVNSSSKGLKVTIDSPTYQENLSCKKDIRLSYKVQSPQSLSSNKSQRRIQIVPRNESGRKGRRIVLKRESIDEVRYFSTEKFGKENQHEKTECIKRTKCSPLPPLTSSSYIITHSKNNIFRTVLKELNEDVEPNFRPDLCNKTLHVFCTYTSRLPVCEHVRMYLCLIHAN